MSTPESTALFFKSVAEALAEGVTAMRHLRALVSAIDNYEDPAPHVIEARRWLDAIDAGE
jgi:hypothetical protein